MVLPVLFLFQTCVMAFAAIDLYMSMFAAVSIQSIHFDTHILRWPRELNTLQLQKTHENRKGTSKSRKYFHQFESRWWKCSQHKQIKKHTANAHNTTKSILFAARFFFFGCVVSICSIFVVKITKVVFLICRCFFLFAAHFFFFVVLWAFAACVLSNWGSRFLNLQVFFLFAACWALSATVRYQQGAQLY